MKEIITVAAERGGSRADYWEKAIEERNKMVEREIYPLFKKRNTDGKEKKKNKT